MFLECAHGDEHAQQRAKQPGLWIAQQELAAPGHPFYQKLNELLEAERFDEFVEKRYVKFYAEKHGRPSLTRCQSRTRPQIPLPLAVPRSQKPGALHHGLLWEVASLNPRIADNDNNR